MVCEGTSVTHGRRGNVGDVSPVILHHLIDTIIVGHIERRVLSCGVQISGVRDWMSLYFTARQRGLAITFLDNPQNGGESDGCVVCFDDPRFVLFHADSGIVTDLGFHSIDISDVRVYWEATGRCVLGIESDEYCFDGCPCLILDRSVKNRTGVETVGHPIL